ncbi:MAG: signal peptide peptidase SppA [Porphyromonadaceae bacterium]|nr:signal peptide peptidase SppA [Porphyromonadaceae bacterium]
MKSFLKHVFATIVGLFIFSIIWVILFFAIVGVAMSGSGAVTVKDNTVFELNLKGVLVERSEEDFMNSLMTELNNAPTQIALDKIMEGIDKAATNDKIKGIYIKVDNFSASFASLQEIYGGLKKFKETGKFIVVYSDYYGNGSYYLSSIADKVYMNPQGTLALTGINISSMFFKGLLDKVGIEMQIFKVGTFKSAVEPFTQTSMSEANRLQLNTYINSIWSEVIDIVAKNRGITSDDINQYANSGGFLGEAQATVNQKFIDSLVYQSDMKTVLESLAGEGYNTLELKDMSLVAKTEKRSKNRIAVVYAIGGIDDGSKSGIDSEKISKELLKLADDDKIKAVVLRVNSPGGSAFGSEQIWHSVGVVKAKKPLVVSMGDYAASGGYYISCQADRIFAQPTTLTGSIGIFGIFPNTKGLVDKIGLKFDNVKTNKFSNFGEMYRPMTDEEKAILQKYIEQGYNLFTKRCADGRGLSQDSIKAIAEGRIYSGIDALSLGLVDELGGLNEAIAFAAQKANLDSYSIKQYPATKTMMEQLTEAFSGSVQERFIKSQLGENYQIFEAIKKAQQTSYIQALMPYTLTVK